MVDVDGVLVNGRPKDGKHWSASRRIYRRSGSSSIGFVKIHVSTAA